MMLQVAQRHRERGGRPTEEPYVVQPPGEQSRLRETRGAESTQRKKKENDFLLLSSDKLRQSTHAKKCVSFVEIKS